MLTEMRIQNLGAIDEAVLELHPGLTVITGETGAGKTMVVTGLHLLSGGRADSARVRNGADRAVVEGRFELHSEVVSELIADAGGRVDDDGSAIASRSVTADGRSRAYLGGRGVPAATLSDLADELIAVHGQNDQLKLLRPAEQRALLDRFAGRGVAGPLARYRTLRAEWLHIATELRDRTERSRELAREADQLRYGLGEIAAVEPQPGEDVALVAEARRLADVDQLRQAATLAHSALAGPEGEDSAEAVSGALELVGHARRELAAATDPTLDEANAALGEVAAVLADIVGSLSAYLDGLNADPARLQQILHRQADLKQLTRKYGPDVDSVLAWAEQAQTRLGELDTSEESLAALAARRDELEIQVRDVAVELSAARSKAAVRLAKAVSAELAGLAMGQAVLEVGVIPSPVHSDLVVEVAGQRVGAGPDGVDEVELRLVPHPGSGALPVHKAASGGELSRVMLALEVVLADTDPVATLVFDEVDAGIGGRAAMEVGSRLARLARSHQVVVVTHLAQVAAYADRHIAVDKVVPAKGLTHSNVRELHGPGRVAELSRMLGGLDGTYTGRAHAEEMLAKAASDKATWDRAAG